MLFRSHHKVMKARPSTRPFSLPFLQCLTFSNTLGTSRCPLLGRSATAGLWICLQNCHLAVSWLPTLERICEELSPDRVHSDFRLWLTSEPSTHFPAFILQNGVKMTVEPPKGMRASLLGSWSSLQDDALDACARPLEFKKLVFGLTFLHATVCERRKFGPLGWNVSYVFSHPDMSISMDQLRLFLDELDDGAPVPFRALAYLAGECNYGGRVTDDKDRRCLMNILSDFYCPDMLRDEHKLSPSGLYFAPPADWSVAEHREYIRGLPYSEAPEVFGLHDNANISCAIAETFGLLAKMVKLQVRARRAVLGGGEGPQGPRDGRGQLAAWRGGARAAQGNKTCGRMQCWAAAADAIHGP